MFASFGPILALLRGTAFLLLASGLLKREEALLYPSGAATRFNRLRPL